MPATTTNGDLEGHPEPLSSPARPNFAYNIVDSHRSTDPHDSMPSVKVANHDVDGLQELSVPVATPTGNFRDGVNAELLEAADVRNHAASGEEGEVDDAGHNDDNTEDNYSCSSVDDEKDQADDTKPKSSFLSNFAQGLQSLYNSQLGWIHGKQTVRHWKPVIRSAISAWVSYAVISS